MKNGARAYRNTGGRLLSVELITMCVALVAIRIPLSQKGLWRARVRESIGPPMDQGGVFYLRMEQI